MLNFASQELNEWRETSNYYEFSPSSAARKSQTKTDTVKLFADKLCVPQLAAHVERPRLFEQLGKSLNQFSATLIAGRAGTGKTALAADYARSNDYNVAWYKLETADGDWQTFLNYLGASLNQSCVDAPSSPNIVVEMDNNAGVAPMTEFLAAQIANSPMEKPLLIVLDDLHSVYDCDWFGEFFNALLSLPTQNVRLLMLARSAPSFPLWRLRSKHVLDVVDEKLLAFTLPETIELFRNYRLSENAARSAHKRSYGRITKLREIAEKKAIR